MNGNPLLNRPGSAPAPVADFRYSKLIVDRDWRLTHLDERACRLMRIGYTAISELIGEKFWVVFPSLVGTAAERRLRQAMRSDTGETFELFYLLADRWLEARVHPAPTSLTILFRDITEAKEQDAATARALRPLSEKLEALNTALSHIADFAYTFDRHGCLTYANKPLLDLCGVTMAQAMGRTFGELNYPSEAAERFQQQIRQVVVTGRAVQDETSYPTRSGEKAYHEYILNPIFDESGHVLGVAGSTRVVTERKRAESAAAIHARRAEVLSETAAGLFVSEDRGTVDIFRRLAAAIGVEIFFHHSIPDGERLRMEAFDGLSAEHTASFAEESLGQGLWGTVAQRASATILEDIQSMNGMEAEPVRKVGIRAFACHPLKADGRVLGTIAFATTSRDRFGAGEIRFMQSAADLVAASIDRKRLLAELRTSRDLAEQASHAKDNFLAALSHELRTPLNPVLLLASNAATNPAFPAAVRADFEIIAKNVALETRLIDDLLDLTRITHGKLSLVKDRLDLHTVLQDALTTVRADMQDKSVALNLELANRPATVRGDAVRLQQVFWNILKNAVKFTPQGGAISVRTTVTLAGAIRVEISDTGIGLTPEEIASAFESFAQGNHAAGGASQFGGLGLGLAITRKMVDLHSGRIEVVSAGRDQGACFIVELPLANEVELREQVDSTPPIPTHVGPEREGRAGIHILLVEDHQPTRQALLQLLVHRQYEVIAAGSICEARAIAIRKNFDLVISDIGLPDGSGYELMAGLRSDFGLNGIALTGYGREQDLALARAAGFIAHLTKPISIQALEAALVAAIPSQR